MINVGHHNSSFFLSSAYIVEPYVSWMLSAATDKQQKTLYKMFRHIPKEWLVWADGRVQMSIAGGTIINNLYSYRLSVLKNGIITLQESKFLCDLLENALRNVVIKHFAEFNITHNDVIKYLPESSCTIKLYEKRCGPLSLRDFVSSSFIMSLTLYQITEIISRKWKVYNDINHIPGFKHYFKTSNSISHKDIFIRDLNYIRKQRNKIAHSKTLMSKEDLIKIYKVCNKWLTPLSINIDNEIYSYRKDRPNFLLVI